MARHALALEHGLAIIAQPEPRQTVQNHSCGRVGGTFFVGILNPEQKFAAVMAGKQQVEQRGPGAANMQQAGGGGGKSHTYGHGDYLRPVTRFSQV